MCQLGVPRLGDMSFDGTGVGGVVNFSVIEMPPVVKFWAVEYKVFTLP